MKTDTVNLYSTSQKIIREEKNSILLIVFIFLPSWLLSGKSLFVLWLRPGRAMINWHDWQHTASCDTTACYRSFLPVWPSHITILCFSLQPHYCSCIHFSMNLIKSLHSQSTSWTFVCSPCQDRKPVFYRKGFLLYKVCRKRKPLFNRQRGAGLGCEVALTRSGSLFPAGSS